RGHHADVACGVARAAQGPPSAVDAVPRRAQLEVDDGRGGRREMKRHTLNTDHPWLRADPTVLATYNAHDGVNTARLIPHLWEELRARPGNDTFYREEVWPTIQPILAMMLRGIPIDLAERTRLRRSFRAEVRECDRLLCEAAGYPYVDMYADDYDRAHTFKPNSDTHVRRWLFGGDRTRAERGAEVEVARPKRKSDSPIIVKCLGLQPALKTDEGQWSVAQDSLLSLLQSHWRKMDEPFRPIIHALLHRARFVKLDEYLDFETEDRGEGSRVYPTIKPTGTKSLRLAYADPAVHSWAKELRSMVRARPGYLLVGPDYSQVEARIAAYPPEAAADTALPARTEKNCDP